LSKNYFRLRTLKSKYSCLSNLPSPLLFDNLFEIANFTQIWSADDQCKQIHGLNASFCRVCCFEVITSYFKNFSSFKTKLLKNTAYPETNNTINMCLALMCRSSPSSVCQFAYGYGAVGKTPCASGKSCLMGECVDDPNAPTGTCIFGDDIVSSGGDLNSAVLLHNSIGTCSQAISALNSAGIDPVFWCNSDMFNFKKSCCKTCSGRLSFLWIKWKHI
jgi:hypothetical protein